MSDGFSSIRKQFVQNRFIHFDGGEYKIHAKDAVSPGVIRRVLSQADHKATKTQFLSDLERRHGSKLRALAETLLPPDAPGPLDAEVAAAIITLGEQERSRQILLARNLELPEAVMAEIRDDKIVCSYASIVRSRANHPEDDFSLQDRGSPLEGGIKMNFNVGNPDDSVNHALVALAAYAGSEIVEPLRRWAAHSVNQIGQDDVWREVAEHTGGLKLQLREPSNESLRLSVYLEKSADHSDLTVAGSRPIESVTFKDEKICSRNEGFDAGQATAAWSVRIPQNARGEDLKELLEAKRLTEILQFYYIFSIAGAEQTDK